MVSTQGLSNRGRFVRAAQTAGVVILTIISYFVSIAIFYKDSYASVFDIINRDFVISIVFIALYWSALDTWLKLNEIYRSRAYGYILLYHIAEGVLGVMCLTFTFLLLGLTMYGRATMLTFGGLSTMSVFLSRMVFYALLRNYRKRGFNTKNVVFICDKGGERLLRLLNKRFEWGYRIIAVVGDKYIVDKYENRFNCYPSSEANIESLLTQGVDEVIYAQAYDSSKEIIWLIDRCNEIGVTFRLYSPFFNRLSTNTQLRYFDTNAVITITNTPNNYVGLLLKRLGDILFSSSVILLGFPFFLIIALVIKLDSKGPIFFKQERSGLRGKVFRVFKFRTMVVNAEELKAKLMSQNEMTGPVFKMTNDPRITRVGRFLRKSGIDEFPQFINVFLGDMSIVGPRPPLPSEVAQYERWQLRRLAMKPGITCLWQVARERNTITFEEWMRMDMEYIDNWSLSLDIVIIIKTIRTVFRADGK
ncbi:MAG: sugar transferase [Bacteroidales bacterium]|nr:sugar transferase [Bacteroidales bacterium]